MAKSKLKCPKCNSHDLYVTEVWSSFIGFTQINGIVDTENGNLTEGDPIKIQPTCYKCGHKWTVRNATQITDVCVGKEDDTGESKCAIQRVSGMLPNCKHENIESSDGCDECLDCGARNF